MKKVNLEKAAARNHEVTGKQELLDEKGRIAEPGWARQPVWRYDRGQIRAPKWRIKEWDYYLIVNRDHAVAFTISDDGYIGLQSVSLLDFQKPEEHTETILNLLPMGKYGLPAHSGEGKTSYRDKRLHMEFLVKKGEQGGLVRRLRCKFRQFQGTSDFSCDLTLEQPETDTMVIATPWKENEKAFYYNQKINCMRASGFARLGEERYEFHPETDFGTLDWGRGVWTYDNRWYWGTGNGIVNGRPFGFNLGYGFGDTSAATENMLFYDGACHKLADVKFQIPRDVDGKKSYLEPWHFTSSDGRFEAEFLPLLDRKARINILVVETDQHQVFGKMNGHVVLDDGTVLELENFLCSVEDVHNRY